MQVILGAGGAIGRPLAQHLTSYTKDIRLVSRKPEKVNETDQLHPADLMDKEAVHAAVEGASVAYLTVGLPYNKHIWQQQWPVLMNNVLAACAAHEVKLVFFDNMYLYDPHHLDGMDEHTPIGPVSVKGRVRAMIAQAFWEAVEQGRIEGVITRAADFMGTHNAQPYETIIKNLAAGKKAMWIGRKDKVHNFTYDEDAAKAVAEIGNTPSAFGRVWHLPSTQQRWTIQEWVQGFAKALDVEPRLRVLPVSMLGLIGLFVPILREMKEMAYQNNRDYYFDSSAFTRQFGWSATAEEKIIQAVVARHKAENQ